MNSLRLHKDQFIAVNGVVYQLKRPVTRQADGARAYLLEHPETGDVLTMSTPEFELGFAEGTIEFAEDPTRALDADTKALLKVDYGAVPESMRKAAERLQPYVHGFYDRFVLSKSKKVLTAFIRGLAKEIGDEDPPAWNTLCRHLARWETAGTRDIRILLPKYHKRGPSRSRLHPFVQEQMKGAVNEVYLTTSKHKAKHVLAAVFKAIERWNAEHGPAEQLACPSLRTVQRAIEGIDKYTKALKRHGKAYADHHYKAVMAGPEARDILEVVEIDHTKVDLKVLDDETGAELGRPWITLVIDRHSRCVVGFYIGFTPPSIVSVAMALRHAMTPKRYVKSQYPEVQSEYPCWGVPDRIVCDHGAEFHSDSFIDAAKQLDFVLTYAPVDCPEFKGKVERFFRTANENVGHTVSGTSHPRVRGTYGADTAGEPAMTFNTFVARFHRWLLDVYHRDIHEGILDVPLRRWQEAEARRQPRRPASMKALDALWPGDRAAITRKGIQWGRLRWNSQELQAIRTLPTFKAKDKVKFRVNPDDVRVVEVVHPVSGTAFAVGPADKDFPTGISLFQWQRAVRLAAVRANGAVDQKVIMTALNDLRLQADRLFGRKGRYHLNKVARFKNIGMKAEDFDISEQAEERATATTTNGASEEPTDSTTVSGGTTAPQTPVPPKSWATKVLRKNTPPSSNPGESDGH